jgi:hypothetical protein
VVALEVVLDRDLPVRAHLQVGPLAEDELVRVDQRRDPAEAVGERRRVEVGADEDERASSVDERRPEAELLGLEGVLPLRPRCRAQRPVEVVGPGVVRTLERLAGAAPARQGNRSPGSSTHSSGPA